MVAEWDEHVKDVDEADTILPEPETFYGSADEFVREFLVVTYRREVSPKGDYRWDGRWWMHPEAVARIDALWRTAAQSHSVVLRLESFDDAARA